MQRILERFPERFEPFAGLLESHERDERAQNLVRALEDQVDARITYGLLVGVLLGVTNAAGDL